MKRLQVLGTGCAKCSQLAENTQTAVSELNVEANVEKVSDITEILSFGVPATPALVLDGKVMVAGRVPSVAEIKTWLEGDPAQSPPSEICAAGKPQSSAACGCEDQHLPEGDKPCCGPMIAEKDWSTELDAAPWIMGTTNTTAGPVPTIGTALNWRDYIGAWKAPM